MPPLIDLSKSGGAMASPAPPGTTGLVGRKLEKIQQVIFRHIFWFTLGFKYMMPHRRYLHKTGGEGYALEIEELIGFSLGNIQCRRKLHKSGREGLPLEIGDGVL